MEILKSQNENDPVGIMPHGGPKKQNNREPLTLTLNHRGRLFLGHLVKVLCLTLLLK